MRVHPQKVVARLTPTAKRMLEQAVGTAVNGQHSEIAPEHLLLAMSNDRGGDTEMLLRIFDREPRALTSELERALQGFRASSAGKPRIGDSLIRWLEDAWLLASLEWGETQLRTGALLAQMVIGGGRYLSDISSTISALSADAMRAQAPEALAATPEASEALPPRAPTTGQAGPAKGNREGVQEGGALSRFTTSFTEAARAGKLDPVFGREREIRQMIDTLCRRRKNNPIIVGEPGVGKTALVEGLALAIAKGEVPESLAKVDLRALDLGLLEAGASVKGEFESRLKAVITEVQTSATPIVLFIDEAHTIIGAGNQKGGADAANLLKPALARGELRTVAATTWSEYKMYFEKDAALERRFQPVVVDEPSEEVAIGIMRGLRPIYEKAHDVVIRDEAIEAAVRLGHRYITGRQLPDKSVDVLDTTAARVRVERSGRPHDLMMLDAELASLSRKRDALTRDLADQDSEKDKAELELVKTKIGELEGKRDELTSRWKSQKDALEKALGVRRKAHELATKVAEGDNTDAAQLPQLETEARTAMQELRSLLGADSLVAIDVDADAVAKTVEQWTGVPVGSQKQATAKAVLDLGDKLKERVLGQDQAIERIAESLRVSQAGLRGKDQPIGVFLLVGPSGVGKTETAHAIAEYLFGGSKFLTTINLSEYQESHTVTRLIGSPPSFVGYGEGGELTEAVRQRPYSVVLLDECEKAALEVMNTFYQVFDRGLLNDAEGRVIDFKNTVILLTSNLASDDVMAAYNQGLPIGEVTDHIRPALNRHFKPALLNRMTVVPFAGIAPEILGKIIDIELKRVAKRIKETYDINATFGDELRQSVMEQCTAIEGGVRFLRQTLERTVLVPLATELLSTDEADLASDIRIGLDESGKVTLNGDSAAVAAE